MLNRDTAPSRPNLFTSRPALRVPLLLWLGLLGGACGGNTSDPSVHGGTAGEAETPDQPGTAGSNAGVSGSNSGVGGHNPGAGGSAGHSTGGSSSGGSPAAGGAAGHASAGAAGQGGSPDCVSPHLDTMTGLTVCDNGLQHRPAPVTCTYTASGTGGAGGSGGEPMTAGAGGQAIQCQTNKDCAGLKYGYCMFLNGQRTCKAGCVQDSDCQTNQFCLCSGPGLGGTCTDTHCTVDADCGGGSLCAKTGAGCGNPTLACTDAADECTFDKDCAHGSCAVLGGHRVCNTAVCSGVTGSQE